MTQNGVVSRFGLAGDRLLSLLLYYCLETLLFGIASSYAIVWTSYCYGVSIVLSPPYCAYLCLLLSSINSVLISLIQPK